MQNHKLWKTCLTSIVRNIFLSIFGGNFDVSIVSIVLLEVICISLWHQRECTHTLLEVCGSCTDTPVWSTHTKEGQKWLVEIIILHNKGHFILKSLLLDRQTGLLIQSFCLIEVTFRTSLTVTSKAHLTEWMLWRLFDAYRRIVYEFIDTSLYN